MTHDERWLKALNITPEPILPVSLGGQLQLSPCPPQQQKKELVVELWRAEQEGCLTLAEEDWWRNMGAIGSLEQRNSDLENTVQNWIRTARENDQATTHWRNAFALLAMGIGVTVMVQVCLWIKG